MNYELAKELKDAGMLLRFCRVKSKCTHPGFEHPDNAVLYHYPTLEEIIEACGEAFGSIEKSQEKHTAFKWKAVNKENSFGFFSNSPSDAVAQLWLRIKKDEALR